MKTKDDIENTLLNKIKTLKEQFDKNIKQFNDSEQPALELEGRSIDISNLDVSDSTPTNNGRLTDKQREEKFIEILDHELEQAFANSKQAVLDFESKNILKTHLLQHAKVAMDDADSISSLLWKNKYFLANEYVKAVSFLGYLLNYSINFLLTDKQIEALNKNASLQTAMSLVVFLSPSILTSFQLELAYWKDQTSSAENNTSVSNVYNTIINFPNQTNRALKLLNTLFLLQLLQQIPAIDFSALSLPLKSSLFIVGGSYALYNFLQSSELGAQMVYRAHEQVKHLSSLPKIPYAITQKGREYVDLHELSDTETHLGLINNAIIKVLTAINNFLSALFANIGQFYTDADKTKSLKAFLQHIQNIANYSGLMMGLGLSMIYMSMDNSKFLLIQRLERIAECLNKYWTHDLYVFNAAMFVLSLAYDEGKMNDVYYYGPLVGVGLHMAYDLLLETKPSVNFPSYSSLKGEELTSVERELYGFLNRMVNKVTTCSKSEPAKNDSENQQLLKSQQMSKVGESQHSFFKTSSSKKTKQSADIEMALLDNKLPKPK